MSLPVGLYALLCGLAVQVTSGAEFCIYQSAAHGGSDRMLYCEEGCCGDTKETVCCVEEQKHEGLSGGHIAAIVIGGYLALMIIVVIAIKCYLNKNEKQKQRVHPSDHNSNVQYLSDSPKTITEQDGFIHTTPYPRQSDVTEPYMFKATPERHLSYRPQAQHVETYVATVRRDLDSTDINDKKPDGDT